MTDSPTLLDIDSAPPSTSGPLLDALRAHYLAPGDPFPGGALLTEVEAPGDGGTRRADAVYLGFTRTPGWCIEVCELKVSREDLRREIAQPMKADAWYPHCTRFWIVSPSPTITPPEMLPDGWGLMCPKRRGRRFQVVREPATRQPIVDLPLLIALAKKLDNQRATAVTQAVHEQRTAHQADLDRLHHGYRQRPLRTPHDDRRLESLATIERLAGRSLDEWSEVYRDVARAEDFGRALRLAMSVALGRHAAERELEHLRRQADAAQRAASNLAAQVAIAQQAYERLGGLTLANGKERP